MRFVYLTVFVVVGLLSWVGYENWTVTGSILPRWNIDKLTDPQVVVDITPEGLVTEDGSLVPLPYLEEVLLGSSILEIAVARGIEVDANGHVYGLLKIHHWCGNSGVVYDLSRIDLSALMLVAGAKPTPEVSDAYAEFGAPISAPLRYGKYGLNVSDLMCVMSASSFLKFYETDLKVSPAP